MINSGETILVLGATGNQGGAVARKLLADGWSIRAISRNPNSPAAQELQKKGATVVQADLDDHASLFEAMRGVYGIYSVQPLYTKDYEKEIQQGKTVADVARQVGVSHFVYSSVSGADRGSGVPHFETKRQIEKYIHTIGLPFTILRPVFFMENFIGMTQVHGTKLMLPGFINAATELQMISVQDIGAFAATAFNNPKEYRGQTLEIAGDRMTLPQVAETFGGAFHTPCEVLESAGNPFHNEAMSQMFRWFEVDDDQVDIPSLRKIHPELLDLRTWVKNLGWNPFVQ